MIYTGNYKNFQNTSYRTISISEDKGIKEDYKKLSYPKLAPKKELEEKWHENTQNMTKEENIEHYIEAYYNQVLKNLDPESTYEKLNNRILLCYEENNEFCHRHIVGYWFEIMLGIPIKEVKPIEDKLAEVEKPIYIKEILNDIISKEYESKQEKRVRK